MNFHPLIAAAVTALASVVMLPAQAAIVSGTFSGTVIDSNDINNTFGLGTAANSLAGQTITGTYSYHSDDLTTVNTLTNAYTSGVYGNQSSASNPFNPLEITETINGATEIFAGFAYSEVDADQNENFVLFIDHASFDLRLSGGGATTNVIYGADGTFQTLLSNILDIGTADFTSILGQSNNSTSSATLANGTSYDFVLTSINAGPGGSGSPISPTAVPEPISIALFGAGLAGLGAIRRRATSF